MTSLTKFFTSTLLISGIIWLSMMIAIIFLANSLDNKFQKLDARIGGKVIIQKDTLVILDYSFFKQNYSLSNGAEVSFSFIENQKLKNNDKKH